jgi:nucleoid-associated protein YgaU
MAVTTLFDHDAYNEAADELRRSSTIVAEARKRFDDAAGILLAAYGSVIPTKVVVVQKGDTLWRLAVRELGNGNRWPELYFMNLDVIKANQASHSSGGDYSAEFSREFTYRLATSPTTIYAGQKLLVMV